MDSKATPAIYPRGAYTTYVLAVLLLVGITSYLDRNVISLLVEPMKKDLLLSDTQISLLQGMAFAVFFVACGLPFGMLVDRVNRRRLLALGIGLWSVMTILCGCAHSFSQLFLARAGVGVGEACLAPAAFSIIADYFSPERRGRAMSVYNMANYLGGSASLFIGGAVLQLLGGLGTSMLPALGHTANWKIVFLVAGLPGLILALLVLTLREPPRRHALAGSTGLAAGGLSDLLRGTAATYAAVYFVSAMTAFAGYTIGNWGPTLFIRRFALAPGKAGLMLGVVSALCGVSGCIASGVIGDRLAAGQRGGGRFVIPLIWWPLALIAVLMMALAPSPGVTLVGYGLFMFGSGLGLSSVVPSIHDITPPAYRGRTTALHFVLAGLLGQTMAPTLVALSTDRIFHDPNAVGWSILLVLAPIIVLSFLVCALFQARFGDARARMAAKPANVAA